MLNLFGQVGNEWIKSGQTYYKIKVASNGVYRIPASSLVNAGIDISNLNPKTIQLFYYGEEQPIYIAGENDGSFDTTDFIEFYGQKNDGSRETSLYRSPEDQPHTSYSLFTDTSVYYLTWNGSTNTKRISSFSDKNYAGKVTSPYFLSNITQAYTTDFFGGIPISNDGARSYSEYVGGEGFHKWVWSSQARFNVKMPAIYASGPDAEFRAIAYSGNHNTGVISGGYNHEFGLSVNQKNNRLATQKTLGYERIDVKGKVSSSELLPTTRVYMGEISYPGSGMYISKLEVTYPRSLDLEGKSSLSEESIFTSSYFRFNNYDNSKSEPIIYDLTNNVRVMGDLNSSSDLEFNLPTSGEIHLEITDLTDIKPVSNLERVNFQGIITNAEVDYLIITNRKLQESAIEYKEYRESNEGGSHNVSIAYVQDIYEQYGYGIESSIALVNFIDNFNSIYPNLNSILFLGKGQSYNRIRTNQELKEAYNLVPIIGNPGSDYLYVSSLDMSQLNFDYAIGRIPARNNEQVQIYLNKLKAFEAQENAEWQKKVIQLAGGTAAENSTFRNYLDQYYSVLKDSSFGGHRVLFSKSEPLPVQTSLTQEIIKEVNEGSSMISYFGHGAAQVTEISLGEPYQYNNFGKTPLFLFNGCALGNTFEDLSLAEKFLFEPNKGALGWIASSNFGFTNSLYTHTLEIHKALFKETYGQGIGAALKFASKNYGSKSNTTSLLQQKQLVYHGDPVLDVFTPNLPDYKVKQARVRDKLQDPDNIELELNLVNLGKYTSDSLNINVNVLSDEDKLLFRKEISTASFGYQKVASLDIPLEDLSGLVSIVIDLDSSQKIAEVQPNGEINNTTKILYLVSEQKPTIVIPTHSSIVNKSNVDLTIQIPGLYGTDKTLVVEHDTNPSFTNPLGSISIDTKETLINSSIALSIDQTDYYVRAKYIVDNTESEWSYRTFGYIQDDSPGLTEGNRWKFSEMNGDSLYVDSASGQTVFLTQPSKDYQIQTSGIAATGGARNRWILIDGSPAIINWWPSKGVTFLLTNPRTDERYSEENNPYNLKFPNPWWTPPVSPYTEVGAKTGVYHYNTYDSTAQDSMIALLRRIPDGYNMVMMSTANCDPQSWKSKLWVEMEKFGASRLKRSERGEPFALFLTKGADPGSVLEHIADHNDQVTPPQSQSIVASTNFKQLLTSGTLRSNTIGPVKAWEKLNIETERDINDSIILSIYTSRDNNDWNKAVSTNILTDYDLSDISAEEYPYLRFELQLKDAIDRTPPRINRWKINCQGLSEGLINYNENYRFESDSILRGKAISFNLDFTNVLEQEYDSFSYHLILRDNATNNIDTLDIKSLPAIEGNQSVTISDTVQTNSLLGEYDLLCVVNGERNVLETNYLNNIHSKRFTVYNEEIDPHLDVVFDGKRIIDQEIVSPDVVIRIAVRDENKYLLLEDPSTISVKITNPDGSIDSISVADSRVFFQAPKSPTEDAILEIKQDDLPGGLYTLNVDVQDATGNKSSETGYEIGYKVIKESSLTNLYPYPNPFSSNMKFVFTLTGSDIPDYFKIQIMTISGKVVREITQDELGQINIGNNVSEFSWDGTDQFGDPLANGVYLYKVTARLNGKEIGLRESAGDEFFSNGFGKIYLVR